MPEWSWQGWCWKVAGDGGGQVEVYYFYLIPFWTKRFMGDLGHQLLAFRKGRKTSNGREKGEKGRRQDTGHGRVSTLPHQPSPPPAHLSLSPCSQISICGSNDPASGPCGQSRSRLIKMKWAADPMVLFSGTLTARSLSHWSASSGRKKKFLSSRETCSPLHCSISEQMSLWKNKELLLKSHVFFNQLCWYYYKQWGQKEKPLIWCGNHHKPTTRLHEVRFTRKYGLKCPLRFYICIYQAWKKKTC